MKLLADGHAGGWLVVAWTWGAGAVDNSISHHVKAGRHHREASHAQPVQFWMLMHSSIIQ